MSRMKVVATSPKLLLASLATVLAAAGITVGSGAGFTSKSANPANTFSAGVLSQANSVDGAILTASKMKPGESASGTVKITNDGDIAGTFSLSQVDVVDTAGANGGKLSSKLDLKIEDVTNAASPVTVYDGKVAGLTTAKDLGAYAAGSSKTYKFTVSFPDGGTPSSTTTGDNAYKGSSLSVGYQWDSVQ